MDTNDIITQWVNWGKWLVLSSLSLKQPHIIEEFESLIAPDHSDVDCTVLDGIGMIGYLNLILRLVIWFLLTSDLSLTNIVIGVGVAFLLPPRFTSPEKLKDWLRVLGEIMVAVPQAYMEAFEIMIRPHNYEDVILERVKPQRTPGLIFLDIFLITFTPKTIVLKYHERGWYEVHRVLRRRNRE